MLTENTKQRIKNYLRLDEISKDTLGRYVKSANAHNAHLNYEAGKVVGKNDRYFAKQFHKNMNKSRRREKGIKTATDKLIGNAKVSATDTKNVWKVHYVQPNKIGSFIITTTYKGYANENDVKEAFKKNNPTYKIISIEKI